MRPILAFAVAAMLGGAALAGATAAPTNQPYDQLPATLATPHTDFADPLHGEKPKVLVIAPCWASREAVEFAQRLSMDLTVIMTESHESFGISGKGGERDTYHKVEQGTLERIARKRLGDAFRYHAIVIGKMPWPTFPRWVREAIVRKVTQGTGLVYVSPTGLDGPLAAALKDDASKLLTGVPVGMLPLRQTGLARPWQEGGEMGPLKVQAGTLGQGRVVAVDYQDHGALKASCWRYRVHPYTIALTPFAEDDPLFYDYYYALLARATRWAARREAHVQVADIAGPSPADGCVFAMERGELPARPIRFSFTKVAPGPQKLDVHWVVRDRDNKVICEEDDRLKLSPTAAFSPRIPVLRHGLHVVDVWLKAEGKVVTWASAALRVEGEPVFEAIAADKPWFERGEAIAGMLTLALPLPRRTSLVIELWDSWGRLLARQTGKANGRVIVPWRFTVTRPLSCAFRVVARLEDSKGVIERVHCDVGVPNRTVDDFEYVFWTGVPNNRTLKTVLRQARRFGMTAVYDTTATWSPPDVYAVSARHIAFANLRLYPYCTGFWGWAVKDWDKQAADARKDALEHVRAYAPWGTIAYSIDEESYPSKEFADWLKPGAVADFQRFLKGKYRTLTVLNQTWGTKLARWEDARPIDLADAVKAKSTVQWLDHRLHVQDAFSRIHEITVDAIHEVDPKGRVGPDLVGSWGFDWPRLWKRFGSCSDADATPAPPGALVGSWTGCYWQFFSEENMRFEPWDDLLKGRTHTLWWPAGFGRGLGGAAAFTPDASEPLPCFEQGCQEYREIRRGIGKVFLAAEPPPRLIAMHYSTVSQHLSVLSHKETTWLDSRNDFRAAVEDLGLTVHSVSSDDLASNALAGSSTRMLILPFSQGMSDGEVAAVKAFARGGGVVVADFAPAVMDEHGRRRAPSPLLDVFGKLEKLHIRRVGKGTAVCVGDALRGYSKRRDAGTRAGFQELLGKYIGYEPQIVVETPDGGKTAARPFRVGAATYFGVLRDETGPCVVRLRAKAHLYDVRRHDYLGYGTEFRTGTARKKAKVFAALPCRLERLVAPRKIRRCRPGHEVRWTLRVEPAAAKGCGLALHVEVDGPDGKRLDCFTQNLVSTTGTFELVLPLALNQPRGRHTVRVREVASGICAELALDVR